MGMAARGHEVLEQAKAQLIQAKTVEQLRQAQAVVLPLSCGLSLEQTAALLGISRGHEVLEQAKAQLIQAKTVEQLRQAQAVVLPLSCGLSLEQTAALLGISVSWTCKLRTRFARGEIMEPKANREHRPRQNMNPEEEAAFLAPFIEKAKSG